MEDNIREWTGQEFGKSQRAVENRESGGNWLQNHLVKGLMMMMTPHSEDRQSKLIAILKATSGKLLRDGVALS